MYSSGVEILYIQFELYTLLHQNDEAQSTCNICFKVKEGGIAASLPTFLRFHMH